MRCRSQAINNLDRWVDSLKDAVEEPQELELLGSSRAQICMNWDYRLIVGTSYGHLKIIKLNDKIYTFQNRCNKTAIKSSPSTQHPKKLPTGVFLLYGNRAWAGIPSRLLGGPCTLDQLSLLAPNKTQIRNWQHQDKLTR